LSGLSPSVPSDTETPMAGIRRATGTERAGAAGGLAGRAFEGLADRGGVL